MGAAVDHVENREWVSDDWRDLLVRMVKAEALVEDQTVGARVSLDTFRNLLQERHIFSDSLERPITKEMLTGYSVLVLTGLTLRYGYSQPYSYDEISAIKEWTAKGGSLLLLGDVQAWSELNAVSSFLGVEFQHNIIEDPTNNYNSDPRSPVIHAFLSHDMTKGLTKIVFSSGSSINTSSPACSIGFTDRDSSPARAPVLACGTLNLGRFVAVGDINATDDWGVSTSFDNKLLLQNMINFIAVPTETVAVLVPDSQLDALKPYLDRYIKDLIETGVASNRSVLVSGNWTKPDEVRTALQNLSSSIGISGSVLVGNIPAAWYEMESQWDEGKPPEHEEFPTDLFYMDLDGIWADKDSDGRFDERTGNITPELWVGRIKPPLTGEADEILLIQQYFDKNHAYRVGNLTFAERALVYVDDDWSFWANSTAEAVGEAYSNYTLVTDRSTTCRTDYLNRLAQGWSLVHVKCHEWNDSISHCFKIPNATDPSQSAFEDTPICGDTDIQTLDAPVFLYNLFICSAARFTEENYLGGWYVFAPTYGLAAVGSTKVGGMQWNQEFYRQLGENRTIGTAFKEWFIASGDFDPKWYYGMVILGDPTLVLRAKGVFSKITDLNHDGKINILDISIVAIAYSSGLGDPKWNPVADLDKNGLVNILDVTRVAIDYR
jgi:hypothetical protein